MQEKQPKVSIIIPVIRPDKAQRCIEAARVNAGIDGKDFEIIAQEDTERVGCPEMVKRLTKQAWGQAVCFLGDDTIPRPNFLRHALDAMATLPDGWGLVGLNDGFISGQKNATHWLADKRLLPFLDGEFFSTAYHHCFCDNELVERCRELGRYAYAPLAEVVHDNPIVTERKATGDYADPYSHYADDRITYFKRKLERRYRGEPFNLAIGWPLTFEMVHRRFVTSWTGVIKPEFTFLLPNFPTEMGSMWIIRNDLVAQARNEGCTHLLMMDTDQVYYDPCTILAMLSHKLPVVGTAVHRRYPPFEPIMNRGEPGSYYHVPDEECFSGDLIEVDATGTGCILYDMKVFEQIPPPWFEYKVHPDGKPIGEDICLCQKFRDAGIPIYVDTSIKITHLAWMEVGRPTYEIHKATNHFGWAPPPDQR